MAERTQLAGVRFGLLANRSSVDVDLRFTWDVLAEAFPGQMKKLFAPQHGPWGEQQANMVESPHGFHQQLGLPIYSLYSETRRPTDEMLADIDCLVIDLQDVGTRIYTFAWTMKACLQACQANDISVVVLDRPNPLGRRAEGSLLEAEFQSFVGGSSIPMRHGLTFGELAHWINSQEAIHASLTVVPLENWDPHSYFDAWRRHWIPPSPNLPRFESAVVYPGQVLLEGTNLSEGRGTTTPFEVCGAPFINAVTLSEQLNGLALAGVQFLPTHFVPTFDKWAGDSCGGVSMHVTNVDLFRPYRTSVAILTTVKELWPAEFQWLLPPYEYETQKMPIDILSGSSKLRDLLDSCVDPGLFDAPDLQLDERRWLEASMPYRLYAENH